MNLIGRPVDRHLIGRDGRVNDSTAKRCGLNGYACRQCD